MTEVCDSFVHSLDRAVRLGGPSVLRVDGRGSLSVYPQQQCYVTDIHDWDSVFSSDSGQIEVSPALWGTPPSDALPLTELQWRAGYHQALSRMPSEVNNRELVQLVSWPNLSRLPEELVVPVTRICALLWRKPTVGYLVPRLLEAPALQTCALLEVLQELGHVSWPRRLALRQESAGPDSGLEAGTESAAPAKNSLVTKLWQRLTRRAGE